VTAPVSPLLSSLAAYPFVRLEEAKRAAAARGIEIIDFGVGDPREPTPELVKDALVAALGDASRYPLAQGLPELREAIADWVSRRFGAELDPGREIIPTLGSKEAIFSLAQAVVGGRRLVAIPDPGYPVYERGALFAGAEVVTVPLREEHGFLPDLELFDRWDELAVFWVNYPNNPTAAVAPLELYERLGELARHHGFLLASDEAYSELWFESPPPSALQLGDRRNTIVFNTLSKRSSMTGFRSGFAAGDPDLVAALRAFRPTVGTAPQEFVQRASIAAWNDERHVEETRARYARKRELVGGALRRGGLRIAGDAATMYLWVAVPDGSEAFAARLLEHGLVVAPGVYLGAAGEGYVRLALVPSVEECERAAAILEEIL
jgi:succinyldiaminopimelate transaminase